MTDWKALCEELADALACHYPGHVDDDELVKRARAALAAEADGPAVPEGREPASVAGEPSDEELLSLWGQAILGLAKGSTQAAVNLAFARAVLARFGPQPAPPAEGEVGARNVAGLFRRWADAYPDSVTVDPHWLTRAADLLERLVAPLPVASDTRYEFSVVDEDCTEQAGGSAPTYAQALSEGQHYLAQYQQDGPHTLELRRVEVLPPGAFPAPDDAPLPVLPEDAQVIEPTEHTILVPARTPVPVSERPWEREGWCDEQGQCWMGDPGGGGFIPSWRLCCPEDAQNMRVSLPFHALPLPAGEVEP